MSAKNKEAAIECRARTTVVPESDLLRGRELDTLLDVLQRPAAIVVPYTCHLGTFTGTGESPPRGGLRRPERNFARTDVVNALEQPDGPRLLGVLVLEPLQVSRPDDLHDLCEHPALAPVGFY